MAHRNNHLTSLQRNASASGAQSKSTNRDTISYLSNSAYRVDDSTVRKKMAEANKMIGWHIGDIISFCFIGQGLIGKVNSMAEALAVILGLTYWGVRIYFTVREKNIKLRQMEWEQQQREKGEKIA